MWRLLSAIPILQMVMCDPIVNPIETEDLIKKNEFKHLIDTEAKMGFGHDIKLTANEIKVNKVILQLKQHDLGNTNSTDGFVFDPSKHFFEYRNSMKTSPLHKMIKQMPKGAVLHIHDTTILSPEYVVNVTYNKDLYVCFNNDDTLGLLFSRDVPKTACTSKWQLMQEARESSGNVTEFDAKLRTHFTIVTKNYKKILTSTDAGWKVFIQYFVTTDPLFQYKPVWEQYFYDVLTLFRNENVMYFEIRSVLPKLYDLDGNTYDAVETAKSYKKVLDKFMKEHPDFFGAKLIYAPLRRVSNQTVKDYIALSRKLKKELPNFFLGFDLTGQESKGYPLTSFQDILVDASKDVDFFFHAGETNELGTQNDGNLADAIALGTKRIGHGFGLFKHPLLMEEVKKKNICVEVCIVSNALGLLVGDIRAHPLTTYMALDMPLVISSDDPGAWESDALTDDLYLAFVGVASQKADLRVLKKFALNSLQYSMYTDKDKIIQEFNKRWNKYIDSIAATLTYTRPSHILCNKVVKRN